MVDVFPETCRLSFRFSKYLCTAFVDTRQVPYVLRYRFACVSFILIF